MLVPKRRSLSTLGLAVAVMLSPWLPAGLAAAPAAAAVVAAVPAPAPQVVHTKPCPGSMFTYECDVEGNSTATGTLPE